MWELTRSAFRFSWSLSLFGAQQMLNLVRPDRAAHAFDAAARAMEGELDGWLENASRVDGGGGGAGGSGGRGGAARAAGPAPPGTGAGAARSSHPAWGEGMPSGGSAPAAPPVPAGAGTAGASATGASSAGAGTAPGTSRRPRTPGWGPVPFPALAPGDPTPGPPPGAGPEAGGGASAGSGSGPGTAKPPRDAPAPPEDQPISAEYPFEGHYVEVHGARMHYVDVGHGRPILFLHGNPTWSYLWRNVIPHLQPLGRCIAPDLVGFGRSSKPPIEYHWADHVRYVEGFIETLGLEDVVLVLHDQGSNLGFHYAMRHSDNVRALAFFEAILRPYPWDSFSTPEFRELFRAFRSGGVGGQGWQMIVEQNVFIEQLLPQAAGRPLSDREMAFYREPFPDPESRIPIWRWPRETPIGGEPPDVWEAVSAYSEALQRSPLPKLLLYAHPGALVTAEHLEWAKRSLPNLETVDLGAGSHFLQESSPHRIGRAIARWLEALPENGGGR